MTAEVSCPQCGNVVTNIEGPTHACVPSAPGCWAAFGALRADEMLRFPGSEVNNLVVDTYMAQHPGNGLAAELPRATYSESALVIEMPAFTCPTYERPTEQPTNSPMGIWLKVSDNRFVGYVRGGGP